MTELKTVDDDIIPTKYFESKERKRRLLTRLLTEAA